MEAIAVVRWSYAGVSSISYQLLDALGQSDGMASIRNSVPPDVAKPSTPLSCEEYSRLLNLLRSRLGTIHLSFTSLRTLVKLCRLA